MRRSLLIADSALYLTLQGASVRISVNVFGVR